jgi:hypothetical protein
MKKNLTEILDELADNHLNTSKEDAVDLKSIPEKEWPSLVGSFIKPPDGTPTYHPGDTLSVEAAADWMRVYYNLQDSPFYIDSNLLREDDSDFGISTGFFLAEVPDWDREQIIQNRIKELYAYWESTNRADRPGYEQTDAEYFIRGLKSGVLFSKHGRTQTIEEIAKNYQPNA